MVFVMIRIKVKNMVNDVRYYFIDIYLCLCLENDEEKTLPVIWTKNSLKIVFIVCDHFQNRLRLFNGYSTEKTKDCNMWTIKNHSCMKFFAFDELFSQCEQKQSTMKWKKEKKKWTCENRSTMKIAASVHKPFMYEVLFVFCFWWVI